VTCRFLGDVEVDGGAGCLTVSCDTRRHPSAFTTSALIDVCQPALRRCRCGGGASPHTRAQSISSHRRASASSCSANVAIMSQNSTCCASCRARSRVPAEFPQCNAAP